MKLEKTLSLVGFICSGKTTIGKLLSEKLCCDFYDVDRLIELRFNQSISEIFNSMPEAEFRNLEFKILNDLFSQVKKPFVLATGGGIVENPESRDFLIKNTRCIYLKNSFENLQARALLRSNPRFWKKLFLKTRFDRRLHEYEKAHHIIESHHDLPEEIVQKVIANLYFAVTLHKLRMCGNLLKALNRSF